MIVDRILSLSNDSQAMNTLASGQQQLTLMITHMAVTVAKAALGFNPAIDQLYKGQFAAMDSPSKAHDVAGLAEELSQNPLGLGFCNKVYPDHSHEEPKKKPDPKKPD